MTDAASQRKQELYRDARFAQQYDDIWQSVGKCVFCDLKDKYILFEENGIVLTVNVFAYADGHLMIIPRRHVVSVKELSQSEWETVRKFNYMAKKLVKDVHGVSGMQFIQKQGASAQSTVEHIHFHCIPFDSPDLCVWNTRQLKYTPLESANLYRQAGKKILRHNEHFERKYNDPTMLPLVCDLIITNDRDQVLLQQRAKDSALDGDLLTLPGGRINTSRLSFEQELAREVLEETGLVIEPDALELVVSRPGSVNYAASSAHLGTDYTQPFRFVWNTYLLRGALAADALLTPGDDCAALLWIDRAAVAEHPRISPELKAAVAKVKL